ncbi:ephrin type-B receptor 1-B-like isoform X1 [Octopus vulgaris]|uniref:receptor protein-tyrosine kinase n=1 Tax=Octopus vulgaris TaxID=6645 RepID=A0AA36BWY1_OCTVU|nr:ephrin type-B receptor 1-B-like isoform X1 [Octopus vulgaris]
MIDIKICFYEAGMVMSGMLVSWNEICVYYNNGFSRMYTECKGLQLAPILRQRDQYKGKCCCSDLHKRIEDYIIGLELLNTRRTATLKWTKYPDSDKGDGWLLGSSSYAGETVQAYSSCYVTSPNINNWLRTPYIERGDAERLHIEMTFTMRKCVRHNDPSSLQQCKETFNLYYYEAESDFANHQMPTWQPNVYSKIDTIAADTLYVQPRKVEVNNETKHVTIKRKGVYFAFQDTGACITLLSVRIFYVTCPNVTVRYAFFMETPTGPTVSSLVQKKGVCVGNAVEESNPTYLCRSDGSWDILMGSCKCLPGYQGINGTKCVKCPVGTYKWHASNELCLKCPKYSYANGEGAEECTCENRYYRHKDDDRSLPCTQPPSPPQKLTIRSVNTTSVTLSWWHPRSNGGRNDLTYRVECNKCDKNVKYIPKMKGFISTMVTLTGLIPSEEYVIQILAENGVSDVSKQKRGVNVTVVTEASGKLSNLRAEKIGPDIILIWDNPTKPHSKIELYEVNYYPSDNRNNASTIKTEFQNYTFKGLKRDAKYSFQVRGKSEKGWGHFSDLYTVSTHTFTMRRPPYNNAPIGIIAGSIVAVILCMAIAIIMIIILLRRNRNNCNEKTVSECDTLQYTQGEVTVPLFQPPGSIKSYIDPHTYEDPNQAVREFTREIDSSHITIESVLGGGEFGDVCKGKLRVPGRQDMTVAIKTLKPGATEKNRLDFLTEASIMGQFEDANVIFLEGVVTKSHPIMIVTEYMANGSLDTFLRNNDGTFSYLQLIGMMRGISSGMKYLSEMSYVHRDLAARNILVNEHLVCKVADFGLSREVENDTTDGAYTTKGGKIPVRWTAPEAIAFRKFTSASDVWSYGVVMWEVMSYGERPYWNWSNQDVIKAVEKGYRLPPPMDCPEAIHQLMLDCWQRERNHRPKFNAIVKTLDKLIRAPELLRKMAKPRPHNFIDPNAPDLTSFTSIEDWLMSIKMERYIANFVNSGYINMEQVARISMKDLMDLNVNLVGHQKKIMNSIQMLRAQIYGAQMSEGFLV